MPNESGDWIMKGLDWNDPFRIRTPEELINYINSNEMKQKAGFGKGGEKNFDGVLTDLQMKTYLVVSDFQKKKRKKDGAEYGWPIALYTTPEVLWDYDTVAASYRENPEESLKKMIKRVKEEYSWTKEEQIRKVLK